jgi:cyclopropane fatty-acyl-phospholipid synthase-like methyltransferase
MTEETSPRPKPDIGAYNDVLASMYDRATAAENWSVNGLLAANLTGELATHIHSALDLGAGTGQTVAAIIDVVQPERIVAVDASASMLVELRNKFPEPVVQTEQTLIEEYAGRTSETFDLVTAMGSMEFVGELPNTLGKIAALLNSGGSLLFTYIPRADNGQSERTFEVPSFSAAFTEFYWPSTEIENSLTSNGLVITHTDSFAAYQRGDETVTYNFIHAQKSLQSPQDSLI